MSFLDDYEPVDRRLAKFWADHPDGRVLTILVNEGPVILFRAELYRGDDAPGEPWATGYAHQRILDAPPAARNGKPNDSAPEWTSPYEVCETSAIGRALANAIYAAKGSRPSREEMQRVEHASDTVQPSACEALAARLDVLGTYPPEWVKRQLPSIEGLRGIANEEYDPMPLPQYELAVSILDAAQADTPEEPV